MKCRKCGQEWKSQNIVYKELTRLKKIGFPDYNLNNMSQALTKHIINIMEEN